MDKSKEEKKLEIKLSDELVGKIKPLFYSLDKISNKIRVLEAERKLNKAKMWELITEAHPETGPMQCRLEIEEGKIYGGEFNEENIMEHIAKSIVGRVEKIKEGDERTLFER